MKRITVRLSVALWCGASFLPRPAAAHRQAAQRERPPRAAADVDLPDTPEGRRVGELLRAFNTGDSATLRAFVARAYQPEAARARDRVAYWAAVYREVGPLSLVGIAEEPPDGGGIYWYRGTVTGAWIGIDLHLESDPPHRIIGTGVRRGIRPRVAPNPPALDPSALADSLHAYLRASADHDHFSGVVVVGRGGHTVFQGAYGFAHRASRVRNTLETPFPLASVTKMFSGVAIAQLVERGALTFDDPIARFIPEYPGHIGQKVTIHHLLTHTSGIELDDDAEYNEAVVGARSVEDLLEIQLRYLDRLNSGNYENFAPLDRFDCTNEGIDLLGVIIARASGMSWQEYLREYVFEPAGMLHAGADLLDAVPGLATGYTSRADAMDGWLVGDRRVAHRAELGRVRPAGTGYATGPDMLRFISALRDSTLLRPESARRIMSPQIAVPVPPGLGFTRSYGYTFDITETATGVRVIGHTGGGPGMSTVVEMYPELGYTVIVLSNFDRAAMHVNLRIREFIGAL